MANLWNWSERAKKTVAELVENVSDVSIYRLLKYFDWLPDEPVILWYKKHQFY